MTSSRVALAIIVAVVFIVGVSGAVPTIGAATGITSNNVTFAISGASGDTYVTYGEVSHGEIWRSDNVTAPSSITIFGAPILGGTHYYAKACDTTGCGNEVSYTTAAITPVPTYHFDAGFNGLVATHWNLAYVGQWFILAYTTNIPQPVFVGLIFGCIIIGFWRKTKSTRLISILIMILGPLIMYPNVGLMLGMPAMMQALGAILFALGLAGTVLSFIKK